MDFDIPKAGHVFETSFSKLPVDFSRSDQIAVSNFQDLDLGNLRFLKIAKKNIRKIEKSKNLNHENSIPGFARIPKNPREVLKNSYRKRVQPSGYQNPSTHLGDTRIWF